MNTCVGILLALSISLYSTPLKADSYRSDQDVFASDSNAHEQSGCEVSPEKSETPTHSGDPEIYTYEHTSIEQNTDQQVPSQEQETYSDSGNYTDVTPENTEQTKRTRNRYWQNILLAVVVVAAAITAMLLVNSHQGHKSHH